MSPTTRDRPLRYVSVLRFSSDAPPSPAVCAPVAVAPIGAYPPAPAVEVRGKRFAAKSKFEETEKLRGRMPRAAGFALSRGSSCSREALREEERLGREEGVWDAAEAGALELAREASSRESREEGRMELYWAGMVGVGEGGWVVYGVVGAPAGCLALEESGMGQLSRCVFFRSTTCRRGVLTRMVRRWRATTKESSGTRLSRGESGKGRSQVSKPMIFEGRLWWKRVSRFVIVVL